MTGRGARSKSKTPPRWTRRIRPAPPRRPAHKVLLGLLALGALVPALTTCDRTKAKESAAPAPPAPAVVVAEVVQKTVPIMAEFVAQTDAVQTVELRARIQGVLEQVRFKEGADVKEGQVLFEIQRTQYEASLQSARAQLAKAQAELARAQEQVEVLGPAGASSSSARPPSPRPSWTWPGSGHSPRPRRCRRWIWTTRSRRSKWPPPACRGAGRPQGHRAVPAHRHPAGPGRRGGRPCRGHPGPAGSRLHDHRAPVSGIIGRLDVDEGNLVGRGEPTLLATMSTVDPIKVSTT